MIDAEFVRVYDSGFHVVAEFRWVLLPFAAPPTFVLSEENLRERIANRQRAGLSDCEEVAALSAIRRFHGETNNPG